MKYKSTIFLLIILSLGVTRLILALPTAAPTGGSSVLFSNGTSPSTTTNLTFNYSGSTVGSLVAQKTGGSSLKLSADTPSGSIIIPGTSTLYLKSGDIQLLSIDGSTGAFSTIGATDLVFKGVIQRGSTCEKVAFPWKRSGGVITLQDPTKKVFLGPSFTSAFLASVAQVNGTTQFDNDVFVTKGSFDGLFSDKAYETANLNDLAARRGRVWGKGRVSTSDLVSASGECTKTLTVLNPNGSNSATSNTIKISRSKVLVSWDGAAAGCPKNWWVCNRSERRTNTTTISPSSNLGACGTGSGPNAGSFLNFYYLKCNAGIKTTPTATEDILVATIDDGYAWLADVYDGTTAINANGFNEGAVSRQDGAQYASPNAPNGTSTTITTNPGDLCNYRPVWCCSYQ